MSGPSQTSRVGLYRSGNHSSSPTGISPAPPSSVASSSAASHYDQHMSAPSSSRRPAVPMDSFDTTRSYHPHPHQHPQHPPLAPSAPPQPPAPAAQTFALPYKRSQRPSWSCTECARRKIKCDKKIPCQSCIKRGCVELCRLEGTQSHTDAAAIASLRDQTPATGQPSRRSSKLHSREVHEYANSSTGQPYGDHASSSSPPKQAWGPSPTSVHRSYPNSETRSPSSAISPPQQSFDPTQDRMISLLERLDNRLRALEHRDDMIGELRDRILDVESVISHIGEKRLLSQRARDSSPLASDEDRTYTAQQAESHERNTGNSRSHSVHQLASQDGRRYLSISEARPWEPSGSSRRQSRDVDRREDSESRSDRRNVDDTEDWRESRNAELAAEDAATALEFIALGKDRRQGIVLAEAEVDSDGDAANAASRSSANGSAPHPHHEADPNVSRLHFNNRFSDSQQQPSTVMSQEAQARVQRSSSIDSGVLPPSNILTHPNPRPTPESIMSTGLSAQSIRAIIGVAKEIGAWQHCCVHFPTFEREVEAFLTIAMDASHTDPQDTSTTSKQEKGGRNPDCWAVIDPAWMSLFFVILSIAIHQMSPEESNQCGIGSVARQTQLASILLNSAMDALSLADYLVKPSVYCCQTIAILCVAGHNICGSDLLTSLLAIGIKTAQTLNLHALGKTARFLEECASKRTAELDKHGSHRSDPPGSCRMVGESRRQFALWKKRIVDLEVGKRVWWACVQQDYFAIPYRGCFSIFEGQYDTPLPHNCSDEDLEQGRLINRDVSELTVASKQRFTCSVAKIVCDFFEDLNRSKSTPSYSLVQQHEERLRFVTKRFTLCLEPKKEGEAPNAGNGLPSFASVLQHYLFISVHHKIIVMHRAFLSRKVSQAERDLSHAACIETARAVLQELERGLGMNTDQEGSQVDLQSRAHGGALWTIPYHSVAAATIIALDMFRTRNAQGEADAEEEKRLATRREEVKRALHALSTFTKKSAIARRGCQLLSDLLEEGKRWDEGFAKRGKRKAGDVVGSLMKRIRVPTESDASPSEHTNDRHDRLSEVGAGPQKDARNGDAGNRVMPGDHGELRSGSVAARSGSAQKAVAGGLGYQSHTPDEADLALPGASFGYGSSNFNPLAGNATTRTAAHDSFLGPFAVDNGLSSLFRQADGNDAGSSANGAGRGDGHPGSSRNGNGQPSGQVGGKYALETPSSSTYSPSHASPGSVQGGERGSGGGPAAFGPGMVGLGGSGEEVTISSMDFSMPQQQFAQILPALESMPDVWRLFDGSLGQNLVAFEESGF